MHSNHTVEAVLHHDAMSVLLPSLVYISILIVAGIPGNIISLLVYGLHLTKVTGRYALITLAVCDIVNCVLSIPVELYIITEYWTFANASLCKMSRFMTYAMNNSSGLILLMIAIERYRAICMPHKTKIQNSFIQKMCVSLVIAGTFLAVPALIIYGIQTDVAHTVDADDHIELLKSDVHNRSLGNFTKTSSKVDYVITKRCLIDDAWRGTAFAYSHFAFVSIASVLVLLILIVLYAQIGRKIATLRVLNISHSDQKQLRMSKKKKKQATLILFLITLAFQFSFIPFIIITNIRFFTEPEWYNNLSNAGKIVYHLFLRSYYFNCAVNPFIYCLSSGQFRTAVKKIFNNTIEHINIFSCVGVRNNACCVTNGNGESIAAN